MSDDVGGAARLADPAANCMGVLRLVLAMLVVLSHAYPFGSFGPDAMLGFSRQQVDWGSFAVHGFFVLSGFLVAQSWDRSRSTKQFVVNRVLRIMPGYWLCLLITVVALAPVLWALLDKPGRYWQADPSHITYLTKNWLLAQKQRDIGSLTAGLGVPHYFNPSLWTLASEFACYMGILVLGLAGAVRRCSWWLVGVFCLFYANSIFDPTHSRWFMKIYSTPMSVRLPIYFVAGSVWWSWQDYMPCTKATWMVALGLGTIATGLGYYHEAMPLILPALSFPLAASFHSPAFFLKHDYSYGVYLYGTPVERLLLAVGLGVSSPWILASLAAVLVMPFAMLSWHFCEKPSLRLKHIFGR
ncbi:MAG: acyltransferase [Verrucomicrobiaceae bacterium]|nr:acyltransferase [Verrucomicrobiaceae bacterium]